jgi:hypothetical protein
MQTPIYAASDALLNLCDCKKYVTIRKLCVS